MPIENPFDFSQQVVLITGPAGALGRPIATAFAAAGATLALADVNEAAAAELAAELDGPNAPARSWGVDVTDPESVGHLVDGVVAELGRIDVLVNTAGIVERVPATEYPIDVWDRVLGANLRGTWLVCQAVGRVMLAQQGGRIVNFASGAAYAGAPGYAAYSPSKAGVVSLTQVLAAEWASQGVGVNAIAPGFVASPMNAELLADADRMAVFNRRMPVGQMLPTDSQVGPTMFLASPAARWIAGVTLRVDGGWNVT